MEVCMSKREHVSISVIRRLPRYFRFLGELVSEGNVRISSKELSRRLGFTASQIRQDLNCFGEFGQQGYGYNVEALHTEIGSILGVNDSYPVILVGAGNIGRAVCMNIDFKRVGFDLVGIFDNSTEVIGREIKGIKVLNIKQIDEFCLKYKPKVAILTVPRSAAPATADRLVSLGITGFWNFSHYDLSVKYPELAVENVHLSDSIMTLSYVVKNLKQQGNQQTEKQDDSNSCV